MSYHIHFNDKFQNLDCHVFWALTLEGWRDSWMNSYYKIVWTGFIDLIFCWLLVLPKILLTTDYFALKFVPITDFEAKKLLITDFGLKLLLITDSGGAPLRPFYNSFNTFPE